MISRPSFHLEESMFTFRGNVAERYGLNAAVVAEYLFYERDEYS